MHLKLNIVLRRVRVDFQDNINSKNIFYPKRCPLNIFSQVFQGILIKKEVFLN